MRRPTLLVGLTMDREELAGRIDARVDEMIAAGAADEARAAAESGASRTTSRLYISRLAPQPCGIPYICPSTEFHDLSFRNGEIVA